MEVVADTGMAPLFDLANTAARANINSDSFWDGGAWGGAMVSQPFKMPVPRIGNIMHIANDIETKWKRYRQQYRKQMSIS